MLQPGLPQGIKRPPQGDGQPLGDHLGQTAAQQERQWLEPGIWVGPSVAALILVAEVVYLFSEPGAAASGPVALAPKQVALALYGPYVLGMELASMLLLAGLVAAYHLGRREGMKTPERGT